MKRFLVATALILAATTNAACSTTSDASANFGSGSVTLRIGDQQQFLSTLFASSGQAAGLSYHLTFDEFGSGPLVDEAFGANAIDVGYMGDTPAMFAQASKLPVRVVTVSQSDGPGTILLARAGTGIHSLADLRGKRIASTKNTAPYGFLLRALDKAGLTQHDIAFVDVPLINLGNILESGTVDAATVSEQQLVAYTKEHPDAVSVTNTKAFAASYGFELATTSALADPAKRAALLDFAKRLVRANAWVKSHSQQWIDAYYVKKLKQTPAAGQLIYQGSGATTYGPVDDRVAANQQAQADLFVRNGLFPNRIDISPQFDKAVIADFNKAVLAIGGKS
jgi:sulfonate transport system substrate-binding protein